VAMTRTSMEEKGKEEEEETRGEETEKEEEEEEEEEQQKTLESRGCTRISSTWHTGRTGGHCIGDT
jgi:hypothetical protein